MLTRIDALRWGWIAAISAGCTALAGIDEDYVPVGASGTSGTRSNAGGTSGGFGGADGSGGVLGSSTGGTIGTAGANGSSGSGGAVAGSDGSGGTPACPLDEKFCHGNCVAPSPANGCGPTTCEACPAPNIDHVEVWCNETQTPVRCDVRCAVGYVPESGRCVPEGTVGTGGTGGGGNGGSAGGGSGGTGGTDGTAGSSGTGGSGGATGASGSGGSGGSGGRCSPNTCPTCPALDGKIPCCNFTGRCGCGYPVVGAFYCV